MNFTTVLPGRNQLFIFALLLPFAFPLAALAQDTDGDLLPDNYELMYSCLKVNTPDAGVDYDLDSMTSLQEYQYSPLLNPCAADTDGDGVNDGLETANGSNPLDNTITPSFGPEKIGADVRFTSAAYDSTFPSLAWNGSEYGVTWADNRDLGANEIYFARMAADGTKIGSDLRVTSATGASDFPGIVWTGSEYGLTWNDARDGNSEIYFVRISALGVKIGTDLRITSAADNSLMPSLVWTGSEYGVSWYDLRDANDEIYFARISAAGVKIDPELRVTSNSYNSFFPSLAWTGTDYGVSWQDDRQGNYEIYFVRISAVGVKIGVDMRITLDANYSEGPSLVWTGSQYGLSWDDNRPGIYEVYFSRLSYLGIRVGTDVRVTSAASDSGIPVVAWSGSEYGISFVSYRDGNAETYFTRVSPTGALNGPDLRVTADANTSNFPALAWTGSEYGVTWYDNRPGSYEIYFARIKSHPYDLDGDRLEPPAETLAGTLANNWDTDNDELSDYIEVVTRPCLDPLSNDSDSDGWLDGVEDADHDGVVDAGETDPCVPDNVDTDGDGLTDNDETNIYHTNPLLPDTDGDGINDGAEVITYGTNPLSWDSDGDALPDAYEIAHLASIPALDPNNALDGPINFDTDGNPNAQEYWNGTDPWTNQPFGGAGCFYWGDSGAGDGVIGPSDAVELQKVIIGIPANYTGVLPNAGETQELSMDGSIGPSDFIIIQKMILGMSMPSLPSRPTALDVLESPGAPVLVGNTCHVTVEVHNEADLSTPGIGVVFVIVSGPGTATLLGGEGSPAPGQRYDISGSVAGPAGRSRSVLRIDGAGAITVQARIPVCGAMPNGRSCPEILSDPVVIIGQ